MQQYLNPPQEAPYMKNATFYLLDNDTTVDGLSAVEQLVCEIAAERWRSGKRVLIACEDEKQAYRLDEALWARPAESFVPHNLAGEGPRGGAPVEIAWPQKRSSSPRDILISLRTSFADFATAFTEVVDFVPYEDSLKQLARERYKALPRGWFQPEYGNLEIMEKTYNPQDIEQPLYEHWEKQGYFKPNGDESQESFLHHDPAAERHRQFAYGSRLPANHHGYHDPLSAYAG